MDNLKTIAWQPRKESRLKRFRRWMSKRREGHRWYNLTPKQQYWFRGLWIDAGTTYDQWVVLIKNIVPEMSDEDIMLGMQANDVTDQDYQKACQALIDIVNGRS